VGRGQGGRQVGVVEATALRASDVGAVRLAANAGGGTGLGGRRGEIVHRPESETFKNCSELPSSDSLPS
jgi:hypothetical protein